MKTSLLIASVLAAAGTAFGQTNAPDPVTASVTNLVHLPLAEGMNRLKLDSLSEYRTVESEMQAHLQKISEKIRQLKPDANGGLSEEQKALMEEFKTLQAETRDEMKAIRKRLRDRIEALKKLKGQQTKDP